MRLRFPGSTSGAGARLSRYDTDRGTIVVQRPDAVDRDTRAGLRHTHDGEATAGVPGDLLAEAARRTPEDRD